MRLCGCTNTRRSACSHDSLICPTEKMTDELERQVMEIIMHKRLYSR